MTPEESMQRLEEVVARQYPPGVIVDRTGDETATAASGGVDQAASGGVDQAASGGVDQAASDRGDPTPAAER
jgi:hypothetical protein